MTQGATSKEPTASDLAIVDALIALHEAGKPTGASSLRGSMNKVAFLWAIRRLEAARYIGTSQSDTGVSYYVPLRDSTGAPYDKNAALYQIEQRGRWTIKVCPPRYAAGSITFPQRPMRRRS
jgi:hypothetical protein